MKDYLLLLPVVLLGGSFVLMLMWPNEDIESAISELAIWFILVSTAVAVFLYT